MIQFIRGYSDVEKIETIKENVEIHIYMEVIYMSQHVRICKIHGLLQMDLFTISDANECIGFGEYELILRKVDTKLTKRYKEKYDWFDWHIEFQVEHRSGLYFHIGNYYTESDGCELTGMSYSIGEDDKSTMVSSSAYTYKKLYTILHKWLSDDKKRVFIHIV